MSRNDVKKYKYIYILIHNKYLRIINLIYGNHESPVALFYKNKFLLIIRVLSISISLINKTFENS